MTERISEKKYFRDLHAGDQLKHLTSLLLGHPTTAHGNISTMVNSMFTHPVHKTKVDHLRISDADGVVVLKYKEHAKDQMFSHRFEMLDDEQSYSRRIIDCTRQCANHAIDLKTGQEIVNHPEAVRQLSLITPLIMASTVAILGSAYVHQMTEMSRIFSGSL